MPRKTCLAFLIHLKLKIKKKKVTPIWLYYRYLCRVFVETGHIEGEMRKHPYWNIVARMRLSRNKRGEIRLAGYRFRCSVHCTVLRVAVASVHLVHTNVFMLVAFVRETSSQSFCHRSESVAKATHVLTSHIPLSVVCLAFNPTHFS